MKHQNMHANNCDDLNERVQAFFFIKMHMKHANINCHKNYKFRTLYVIKDMLGSLTRPNIFELDLNWCPAITSWLNCIDSEHRSSFWVVSYTMCNWMHDDGDQSKYVWNTSSPFC